MQRHAANGYIRDGCAPSTSSASQYNPRPFFRAPSSFPLGGTGSILSPFPVGAGVPDGSRAGELTAEAQRMEGHPRHPSILAPNLSTRGQFQTG